MGNINTTFPKVSSILLGGEMEPIQRPPPTNGKNKGDLSQWGSSILFGGEDGSYQ
jgi:hypothetical protein